MVSIQFIQTRSIWQTNRENTLFDWISNAAGEEAAIEATSWAELACVGEEYVHLGDDYTPVFTLRVIDNY